MLSRTSFACRAGVAILAFLALASNGAAAPQKIAVLVGINDYKKAAFENLKYAENDVDAAAAEFQQLGFKTTLVKGSAATRENILGTLDRTVKPLGKDDLLLLMLCGHGQQLRFVEDAVEHDDGFFCPYDAERGVEKRGTLISLSHMIDVLAANVGTKILLVDACREPPADVGRRGIQGKVVAIPEGTAILFACSAGQRSFEPAKLEHGLFTYCLIESLRKAQVSGRDVTWGNVVEDVFDQMESPEMLSHLPSGFTQRPIRADALPRTVLGRMTKLNVPRPEPKQPIREPEPVTIGRSQPDTPGEPPPNSVSQPLTLPGVDVPFTSPKPSSRPPETQITYRDPVWQGVTLVRTPRWDIEVYGSPFDVTLRNTTKQSVNFYFKIGDTKSHKFVLGVGEWITHAVSKDKHAQPLISIQQTNGEWLDYDITGFFNYCFALVDGKLQCGVDPLPITIGLENLRSTDTDAAIKWIGQCSSYRDSGVAFEQMFPRTYDCEFTNRIAQPPAAMIVTGATGDFEIKSGETGRVTLNWNQAAQPGAASYDFSVRTRSGVPLRNYSVEYGFKINVVRYAGEGTDIHFRHEVVMPPSQLRTFYAEAVEKGAVAQSKSRAEQSKYPLGENLTPVRTAPSPVQSKSRAEQSKYPLTVPPNENLDPVPPARSPE